MELSEAIESLTEWVQTNLCDVELLKPSDTNMSKDYEPVKPKAFSLYVPPKDSLPPDVDAQIPSICVQLKDGSDDLKGDGRSLNFRLAFSAYRPGRFEPVTDDDGKVVTDDKGNPEIKFIRNTDGWKDLWLWISRSLNRIYKDVYIEGMRVDRTTPVKYGHFSIDDTLVDAYPFWYAYIEFTMKCGLKPSNNSYNEFL